MTDSKSTCCGKPVNVFSGDEGTNHWTCGACGKACDVVTDSKTAKNLRLAISARKYSMKYYYANKETVSERRKREYRAKKKKLSWLAHYRKRKRITQRKLRENDIEGFRAYGRIKARGVKQKPAPKHKSLARSMVRSAILKGTLKRPSICSRCKSNENKIHAHHPDYSKPLKIKWLCSRCHGLEHRIND